MIRPVSHRAVSKTQSYFCSRKTLGLFISQYLQHALRRLFLCVDPIDELSILIITDDHVLGRGDQAMFDAAVTADLILVGAGMKKTDIQRFAVIELGQEHFIDMLFGIVVIMAVAGD